MSVVDCVRKLFLFLSVSIGYFGVSPTILGSMNRALLFFNVRAANAWYKRVVDERFDRRLGVSTGGVVSPENLDFGSARKKQAVQYQATSSVVLGVALSALKIDYSQYVFIDFGSGRGRALFMAAAMPFKRVVGVELSRSLHESCQRNIAQCSKRRLKCQDVASICDDAVHFELPPNPLVIYFFQPFKEEIFRQVMAKIDASLRQNPRHIVVLYSHPGFPNMIGEPAFMSRPAFHAGRGDWDFYETRRT
jgi:SAM-dependent methyltransferase